MVDLSIIIVNWNTEEILKDCLVSVYEQDSRCSYEVVVVDNDSSDNSVEMIRTNFPQTKLIENTINKGFAAANNQGIEQSEGRYVLLLNSDTIVLDDALDNTVAWADENPETGVVGCRVLNPDRTLQYSCFMFPSIGNMLLSSSYLYKLFPRSRFFGREHMTWWDRNDVREVDVVTGCFMLVRREALDQVGLLDENFFMYAEETDWCYRFKQTGWKVMFAPVGEIIHLGGQSSRQVRAEMLVQLRLSILQFMRKHHNRLTFKTACLLQMLFFSLRLPVIYFKSSCARNGNEQAAVRFQAYLDGIRRIAGISAR